MIAMSTNKQNHLKMQLSGDEISISGMTFKKLDLPHLDKNGFLFDLGVVYACSTILSRFDMETVQKRLRAHAKREVGEYNRWLMTEEEQSDLEHITREPGEAAELPNTEELVELLAETLPEELLWIPHDLVEGVELDLVAVKTALFKHLDEERAGVFYQMIYNHVSPSTKFMYGYLQEFGEDFWNDYHMTDKDLESIENDETIDSFFLDDMVVMTTPLRKATIIFMEQNIQKMDEFYMLDRVLAA